MMVRVSVAVSARSVRKLCTGNPSGATPVFYFRIAVSDRCAGVTTLTRAASTCRIVQYTGLQADAHYIHVIGGGFGGDLGSLAHEGEAMIVDGEIAVLAQPVLRDHGTDSKRDFGRAAQRIALACHGGLDAA
jgi:hypothetical protein